MEQQVQKKKKKIDLLAFQRGLNEQFLEIFHNKQLGSSSNTDANEIADLGLEATASGFKFFIPLKNLKTISMDNNFESIVLTKSWVVGFNQLRGEVYTVTDLEKIIELILEKKNVTSKMRLGNDSRIVYLKDNNEKIAFSLAQLKLDYTAEFTSIFKCNEKDNKLIWNLNEGIDFDSFVKKNKMSEKEWEMMNQINAVISLGDAIENVEEKLISMTDISLLYFIKDVYLDGDGARPVFVLNPNNLTKFLSSISPF